MKGDYSTASIEITYKKELIFFSIFQLLHYEKNVSNIGKHYVTTNENI